MDVFGFLDGFFSAVSAAFSGKKIDTADEQKNALKKQPAKPSSPIKQHHTNHAQQRIRQARESNRSRSHERELR